MQKKSALGALAALAQESRLDVFRLLVQVGPEGLAARKIADHLGITPPALSFHLKELTHACLVSPRQAGRSIIYTANLDTMGGLVEYLSEDCCKGIPCGPVGAALWTNSAATSASLMQAVNRPGEIMEDKIYNVLFLCTGNSSRSIMAEALLNTMGKGRFRGYSAGSHPTGAVNPIALEQIRGTGYAVTQMRSKSWDEFSQADAPHMDFVFTVCDNAAGEVCPIWPGHPISAHWGFEDPAAVTGTDEQKRAAFNKVYRQILTRMNLFTSLPLNMLENNAIQAQVSGIGSTPV